MGRTKKSTNISQKTRQAIIEGQKLGRTHKELAEQFQVARTTVTNLIRCWRNGELSVKTAVTGRPRITSSHVDRTIVTTSRRNPRLNASDIAKELAPITDKVPSKRTIRRRLQESGLNARRPVKKPLIKLANRKLRVLWAKAHLHWTRADWERVNNLIEYIFLEISFNIVF